MPQKKWSTALAKTLTAVAMTLILLDSAWAAPKYKVLHAFGAGKDGAGLYGGLVFDQRGNLYGGSSGGGDYGYGTVFQLSRGRNGAWSERVLRSFRNNDPDGDEINGSLTVDAVGRVYGGTTFGGGPYTHGTVFEMTPQGQSWGFRVIHRFGRNDRAGDPFGGLILDAAGNLYGAGGCAFELSPEAGGKWKEHILHCFPAYQGDGSGPYAGVIMEAGRLYGTTERGGAYKAGTVYELRSTSGGWKERVLHSFPASQYDGQVPGVGALVSDGAGSVYGTTLQGGRHTCGDVSCGTVFKLAPTSHGQWKETILYNFCLLYTSPSPRDS